LRIVLFSAFKSQSHLPELLITTQVLTALGGGAAFYVHLEREKRRVLVAKKNTQSKGEAAIGGDFELVDVDGKLFHSDKLKGNWCILCVSFASFVFCAHCASDDEYQPLRLAVTDATTTAVDFVHTAHRMMNINHCAWASLMLMLAPPPLPLILSALPHC